MGALDEALIQTGHAGSHGRRTAKALLIFAMLLGVARVSLWALGKDKAEDPATSLSIANAMQLPKLRSPMVKQVRARNVMMPVQTSNSPNSGEMSKREMLGGAIASAAALVPSAANAGVALDQPPPKPRSEKGFGLGTLAAPPTIAVGWVFFNILGPALNQLDDMSEEDAKRKR